MADFIPRFLRQLRDVVLSSPADGEVLTYDDGTGKWVNAPSTAGGASAAADVSFAPAGGLSSTNVQAALQELDTEKAAASHAHAGEDITSGTVADARIASSIARDSEVSAAISASESGQVRDGDTAGGVLSGTYPNPGFAVDMATQGELDAHVNDTSAAHAASAISADSTTLVGVGTDVQAVLEELDNGIADHLADTTAAHAGSAISFTPAGTISSTTVQAAIEEVSGDVGSLPTVDEATHAASSKATPVDADEIPLADSAASFALKKLTWSNLKATLKTYFDTLYQPLVANLTALGGVTSAADKLPYFTGSGSASVTTLSSFIRTLLDDADQATAQATLGITAVPTDGWTAAGETWTYAAADSPTFTFTVGADVTAKYAVGQRIKLTQTTVKYFIIVAVSTFSGGNTTITVYGGTDYTLANASITNPYWSMFKAPFGFPPDPAKWTVEVTDTSNVSVVSPTGGWVNSGSIAISVPIGCWRLSYRAILQNNSNGANIQAYVTLSTANNSESDASMTCWTYIASTNSTLSALGVPVQRDRVLSVTSKTTYYLNEKTTGGNAYNIRGDNGTTILRAVCAYL